MPVRRSARTICAVAACLIGISPIAVFGRQNSHAAAGRYRTDATAADRSFAAGAAAAMAYSAAHDHDGFRQYPGADRCPDRRSRPRQHPPGADGRAGADRGRARLACGRQRPDDQRPSGQAGRGAAGRRSSGRGGTATIGSPRPRWPGRSRRSRPWPRPARCAIGRPGRATRRCARRAPATTTWPAGSPWRLADSLCANGHLVIGDETEGAAAVTKRVAPSWPVNSGSSWVRRPAGGPCAGPVWTGASAARIWPGGSGPPCVGARWSWAG